MELDELKLKAAALFPEAVKAALENPGQANPAYEELHGLCWSHFETLGFGCQADCFAAVVPKCDGELKMDAWSRANVEIHGWPFQITFRPFYLGASYAHFEVRHNGPLPGLTETGYRSIFVPFGQIVGKTPLEFLSKAIPARPKAQQLTLF